MLPSAPFALFVLPSGSERDSRALTLTRLYTKRSFTVQWTCVHRIHTENRGRVLPSLDL
jgi:hypothetical protein